MLFIGRLDRDHHTLVQSLQPCMLSMNPGEESDHDTSHENTTEEATRGNERYS